jgi:hypothetical protein
MHTEGERERERERERLLARMEAKIVRRRSSATWKPDRGEADAPAPCAAIDLSVTLSSCFLSSSSRANELLLLLCASCMQFSLLLQDSNPLVLYI